MNRAQRRQLDRNRPHLRRSDFGTLSRWVRGYKGDAFSLYKPGATALVVEGAGSPDATIATARQWGCRQIEFSASVRSHAAAFTYETAMLAKQAGLDVLVSTAGIDTPEAIRKLAPVVDAVCVRISGSLGAPFYAQHVTPAPDLTETVRQSAVAWREAGVYVTVQDIIPPAYLQSDEAFAQAHCDLVNWMAAALGPYTPLMLGAMTISESPTDRDGELVLPKNAPSPDFERYMQRIEGALDYSREWMPYTYLPDDRPILCHNCGGVLLRFQVPRPPCDACAKADAFCGHRMHEQHVTGGNCDYCGAAVPVVTLPHL